MWKTLHPTTAIEAMAITIRFAEPLNTIVLKRLLRDVESAAKAEGFIDQQQLQKVEVKFSGDRADVQQSPLIGMVFQHNSLERGAAGVAPMLARQLTIQPESVLLQVFKYRGWKVESASALKLLAIVIKTASAAVAVGAFRLEYLNRFIYEGTGEIAPLEPLLQKSSLLAPHIFDGLTFWHSHTGRFEDVSERDRILKQVNADLQVHTLPHPAAGKITVGLLLAAERQYPATGFEVEPSDVAEIVEESLNLLHDHIYSLFKAVVSPEFSKENGLPA